MLIDRCADRCGECGADGAVRFGQIDSDEHYRLSGSAHGDLCSMVVRSGRTG